MRKTKRRIEFFRFYDYQGIARHLEKMAQKGWMISKISNYFWTYRRIQPTPLRFAVTYFPEASDFNPEPTEHQQDFMEYCQAAGWQFTTQWAQMQIFYNENLNAVPLETDEFSRLENIHRCMRKNFLPGNFLLLGLMILLLVLQLITASEDLAFSLASNSRLIVIALPLLAIVDVGIALIGYYLWRRRSQRSIARGGSCIESGPLRSLPERIMSGMVLLLLVLYLFTLGSRWVILLVPVAATAAMIAVILGARSMMRKKGFGREANIAAIGVLIVVLSVGYGFGQTFFFSRLHDLGIFEKQPAYIYTTQNGSSTWDWKVYNDPIPLTVEDLRPTDYPHYSCELTAQSSPLASVLKASQTGFPDELGGDERLLYTVIRLKQPFWYEPVLKSLLKSEEKFIYDPFDSQKDTFLLVQAPEWGASAVYQRHIGEEALPEFYVCYAPGCILQLDLSWEPTAEQIAIIRQKLGL